MFLVSEIRERPRERARARICPRSKVQILIQKPSHVRSLWSLKSTKIAKKTLACPEQTQYVGERALRETFPLTPALFRGGERESKVKDIISRKEWTPELR